MLDTWDNVIVLKTPANCLSVPAIWTEKYKLQKDTCPTCTKIQSLFSMLYCTMRPNPVGQSVGWSVSQLVSNLTMTMTLFKYTSLLFYVKNKYTSWSCFKQLWNMNKRSMKEVKIGKNPPIIFGFQGVAIYRH